MGVCDQPTVEGILDFFYEQVCSVWSAKAPLCRLIRFKGGNFIDTSNNYQFEESEIWIGEWMKKRGVRDQMGE